MKNIEKEYNRTWKDILEVDGVINVNQLKKELFDFSALISNVGLVYDSITNSRISKPLTNPIEVIKAVNEIKYNYISDMDTDELIEELQRRGIEVGIF